MLIQEELEKDACSLLELIPVYLVFCCFSCILNIVYTTLREHSKPMVP